jgi:hypothetical protein
VAWAAWAAWISDARTRAIIPGGVNQEAAIHGCTARQEQRNTKSPASAGLFFGAHGRGFMIENGVVEGVELVTAIFSGCSKPKTKPRESPPGAAFV